MAEWRKNLLLFFSYYSRIKLGGIHRQDYKFLFFSLNRLLSNKCKVNENKEEETRWKEGRIKTSKFYYLFDREIWKKKV